MKNKMKLMAILSVAMMLAVSFAVVLDTDDNDAASIPSPTTSYSYTMTLDASGMASSTATLTVNGMTPISHPNQNTYESLNAGSWGFDTTTGIGPFNSFYGAFDMTNGNAFYAVLDPNNLTQTIGGVSLNPLANYNIMWVVPTVYISVDSTTGALTLSNDPTSGEALAHTIDGHIYSYIAYGVYEASSVTSGSDTVLTSTSGTMPTVSQTRAQFRTAAANNDVSSLDTDADAHAMLWNYYMWNLYRYIGLMTMEDWNSQAVVGGGHVFGLTYAFTTGACDTMGPYAGYPMTGTSGSATEGSNQAKLFLEGAWGGVREFVDGVVVNGQTGFAIQQVSLPTDVTSGDTVTTINVTLPESNFGSSVYSNDVRVWGVPSTSNSSQDYATKGVADKIYTNTSNDRGLTVGGSSYTNDSDSVCYGLSCMNATNGLSNSYSSVGARLAFVFDNVPKPIDVTLNPGKGSVTVDTITVNVGDPIGELPDASRPNYTFLGWFTQPIGGTEITPDTIVTDTEDFTIYAQWELVESLQPVKALTDAIPLLLIIGFLIMIVGYALLRIYY